MGEALSWIDSDCYISTGVPFATSGFFALCENTDVDRQYGYVNTVAANGVYYNHITGQIANVTIAAAHTVGLLAERIFDSKTACHLKFVYSGAQGTGGIYLYSGQIKQFTIKETHGAIAIYTMQYYANNWSAF